MPALLGRAAGDDFVDPRFCGRLTDDHEGGGEYDDRENEVGNWAGRNDRGALPDGFAMEIAWVIGGCGNRSGSGMLAALASPLNFT